MKRTTWVAAVAASLLLTGPAPAAEKGGFQLKHIWLRHHANMMTDPGVAQTLALMERAAKSGYTGVVIINNRFHRWGQIPADSPYYANLKKVRAAADRLKLKLLAGCLPMGYANDMLSHDPNLAAGMPVVDAPFVVKGGKLGPADPVKLVNPTFAEGRGHTPAGWSVDKPGKTTFMDPEVRYQGKPSLRFEDPEKNRPNAHARAWQIVEVRPWTYYHFSVAFKTENLTRPQDVRLMALGLTGEAADQGGMLNIPYLYAEKTRDWTRKDMTFNTRDCTKVAIYVGTWSSGLGKLWFADVRLEPGGLVNLLRREGAPFKATSPDGKTVYVEGKDLPAMRDPKMGKSPYNGGYHWHAQPEIRIPAGSRLKDGDKVLLSYTHTALMCYGDQVPICMAEPKTNELVRKTVRHIAESFRPDGYFMMHDEIRMQGWDASCRRTGKTCGQILADNTRVCVEAIRTTDPGKLIYVWSDMYDKTHNAQQTGHYELCRGEGPWAGSWEGLAKDVGIMNWCHTPASLKWFASRGHEQVISHNSPGGIVNVLRAGKGIDGVVGVMYTTWSNDYGNVEAYARAVKDYARKASNSR